MPYAAIGGMQLKHWTGYLKIIGPTVRLLFQAKRMSGCLKADMFKSGSVYFAVSVWDNEEEMKQFARNGLHKELMGMATETMSVFHNHTHQFEDIPTREQSVKQWNETMKQRSGRGSVGVLKV